MGYPKETVGYTFYHRSEGNIFVAKNGSFLEKEFLSKEVSGRKVELDEITVPAPLLESSSPRKPVSVTPTPISEEADGDEHETSDQVTTEPRRSTRVRFTPEWYGNPILAVMLLDHDEPTNYEEAMMSPDFAKWIEVIVFTLLYTCDLPLLYILEYCACQHTDPVMTLKHRDLIHSGRVATMHILVHCRRHSYRVISLF